ncbi:MAG: hypothetical protein VKK80_04775 [Prochlorothrix sp.]|nr:hypothetical protein [Prochlorothrix sp.]
MKISPVWKEVNPLDYPLALLLGGLVLVLGVRGLQLPSIVVLPVAGGVAGAGAIVRRNQEPEQLNLGDPALEGHVQAAVAQAANLAAQAERLRREAGDRLTESHQLDLLVAVQLVCDQAQDLPQKIKDMARKLHKKDTIVSIKTLEQQLKQAQAQKQQCSGDAQKQWQKLIQSLQRNIELAQQGDDVRQAQIISLSNLILETLEVLQQLQLQLHQSNLSSTHATNAAPLSSLSETLTQCQKNLDLLTS